MKRWHKITLSLLVVVTVITCLGWGYYKHKYPYGYSHRCSKVLALLIQNYADEHDGKFPSSTNLDAVGLSALIDYDPSAIEMVVGKAGDLDEAKRFYHDNGYLKPEHCSWHYVEGLTTQDDRALLWDKIPLGHNGQRTKNDSREVITTQGIVQTIPAAEWENFLGRVDK